MFDIVFPKFIGQKYYHTHFRYVLEIFKYLKCNITYTPTPNFVVKINGKDVFFDMADTSGVSFTYPGVVFKYHCIKNTGEIIPFPPISFYDWEQYYQLEEKLKYRGVGFISYRQREYAGAKERRQAVKKMLSKFPDVETNLIQQEDYWHDVPSCSVAVFVPGAFNNMLDRAHFQMMAFGCCTISPNLREILPFNKSLIPGVHYIQCKDDYSDLEDIIMKMKVNSFKGKYIEIGQNAKQLFLQTSTPEAIGDWIEEVLA